MTCLLATAQMPSTRWRRPAGWGVSTTVNSRPEQPGVPELEAEFLGRISRLRQCLGHLDGVGAADGDVTGSG